MSPIVPFIRNFSRFGGLLLGLAPACAGVADAPRGRDQASSPRQGSDEPEASQAGVAVPLAESTASDPKPEPEPPLVEGSVSEVEPVEEPPGGEASPSRGCRPPAGVSGRPRRVAELVALLDALPKPTSVACFLESLDRPLEVYVTRSALSAQPAAGEDAPRVFLFVEDLVLSVVLGGPAGDTLEFGLRVAPDRAVRGEIEFPVRGFITAELLRDRIDVGGSTLCATCHRREQPAGGEYFAGTIESDVVFPFDQYEVPLERMREIAAACDPASDFARCSLYEALLGHGEVVQVPFR